MVAAVNVNGTGLPLRKDRAQSATTAADLPQQQVLEPECS
jgi:hypothetical protein